MSLRESLIGLLLVIGVLAGAVMTIDSCHRKEGQAQGVNVAQHEGAAVVHQTNATEADAQIPALKKQLQAEKGNVDRLKAELESLKHKEPEPHDCKPSPDTLAVIAKQDEIICAQDKQIKVLESEVVVLTKARDEWKQTAEERLKQSQAQEAATAAWKAAVSTSTTKGRIQGFAVGLVLGYIGGKK